MRTSLLLLGLAALAAPAHANIAAPRPNPAVVGGPLLDAQGNPLRVKGEQLSFDCELEGGQPICRFTARYQFVNASSTRQAVLAAFRGVRTTELQIVQDGRAIGRQLSANDRLRFTQAVRRGEDDVLLAGMQLDVEPHRTALVTVTGRMTPGRYFQPGYDLPAVRTRHIFLGSRPERSNVYNLEYLISPIRTWGPAPEIAVTLRHPASWELRLSCRPREPASQSTRSRSAGDWSCPAARREREGGRVVQTLTVSGEAVDTLGLAIEPPERLLFHGGPILGIGGNLDDSRGLRARFGYEIALPRWLMLSLALDTNFQDDLVLAPGIEAATPSVLILPSLGLGLGLPIRLVEERRVGLRVQLTVQWPLLGWVTSFDIYPGQGFSDPRRFQVSMLAQFGL